MPSTTCPSTGTTSPVWMTIRSPFSSRSVGTWTSVPSRQSQANFGCLPKASSSSFCDRSRDCFTRKRPKLRHQQQTAPGKIDMVPRQPTITTASSASTPIRFSSTKTRRASLNVGTDVYA